MSSHEPRALDAAVAMIALGACAPDASASAASAACDALTSLRERRTDTDHAHGLAVLEVPNVVA